MCLVHTNLFAVAHNSHSYEQKRQISADHIQITYHALSMIASAVFLSLFLGGLFIFLAFALYRVNFG